MTAAPEWFPERDADYDRVLGPMCASALSDLRQDANARRSLIGDPRPMHRRLFAQFAPAGFADYAGTYRGEPNTVLAARSAFSMSQLNPPGRYPFSTPQTVAAEMANLTADAASLPVASAGESEELRRFAAARVFTVFGRIHPFLDGNGHVQRLYFAAVTLELGLKISQRWQIHPRPYDRLFAIALELEFRDHLNISLVEEYLRFYFD